MSKNVTPPIIGLSGCRNTIHGHEIDSTSHYFVEAVDQACGAIPMIIPALGDALDRQTLLRRVDGLIFTGSASNVEPFHYDGPESADGTDHDPDRDATTLPLIRDAVDAGVPILCVCRGFQELNVAFGGSLHQRVFEVPGLMEHRSDPDGTWDERYGPAHKMSLVEDGFFAQLAGTTDIVVNSLHGQGVDRLADGLNLEATAPDGMIEGATVKGARRFVAGVQWHPEFGVMENDFSRVLFGAFADSARENAVS